MKKPANTHDPLIFSIYADDKPGLIGQIMIFFNRRSYQVSSLNVARTDISDLVMVTIEACVPGAEIASFCERIKKIVEIYDVAVRPAADGLRKVGFYRLSAGICGPGFWTILQKYGAAICSLGDECLVIEKTGFDHQLSELYACLEGPYLLGFCKSALIADDSLRSIEDLEQIHSHEPKF